MKQLLADEKMMSKKILLCLFLLLFLFYPTKQCISQESTHVSATSRAPGKAAAYKFSFINDAVISEKTEIQIEFPRGYDLSGLIMATMGSVDCTLITEVKGNVVQVKQTKLTRAIPNGSDCELYLASIINPKQFEKVQDFTLNFYESGKKVWRKNFKVTIEQLTANTN